MTDIAPEGNRASDAGTPPGGEPGVPRLPGNPRFFKPKSLYVRHVKVLPTDAHEKVRTKDNVLFTLLEPVLSARTPDELQKSLIVGQRRMLNTGVYEQVEFQNAIMDNSGKLDKDGQIVRPTTFPVDVFMAVKESKFTSSIGGDICRGADNRPEAQAKFSLAVLNPTGRAETITASMHRNQHGSDVYSASFYRPTLFNTMRNLKLETFSDSVNFMARSAYVQQDRGFKATLGEQDSPHTFSYLAQWRDLLPSLHAPGSIESTASKEVISETAPSFKSALQYTFSKDARHIHGAPISGGNIVGTGELAGLGGDVKHVRGTVSAQYNWTWGRTLDETRAREGKTPTTGGFLKDWLSSGLTLGVSGSAGVLLPLGGTRSNIVDRFFIGGNDSLRCFGYAGVGPRAPRVDTPSAATGGPGATTAALERGVHGAGSPHGDALGGNAMWHCTARVLLPSIIPWKPLINIGARTQLFASAGNVTTAASASPSALAAGMRSLAGIGYVLPIPIATSGAACIEVNVPLWRRAAPQDVVVGIGIGVSF